MTKILGPASSNVFDYRKQNTSVANQEGAATRATILLAVAAKQHFFLMLLKGS